VITKARAVFSAGLLLALIVTSNGCVSSQAQVTSAWPRADAERTVDAPARPATWPLTGMPAPDGGVTARRPVVVKIDNSPQARPQTGLNSADVVYETLTEGGITRFDAIYHSTLPKAVGPVRSARLVDTSVVPQYVGILFSTGASASVKGALRKANVANVPLQAAAPGPYYKAKGKAAPHDVYLDARKAHAEAARRALAVTAVVPALRFTSASRPATVSIVGVSVPFSDTSVARWTYNPRNNAYGRSENGSKSVDAAGSHPVQARNVVVLWTRYKPAAKDRQGAVTYDVVLRGSGRASVFRDGQRYDATWEGAADAPPRLVAKDGSAVRLAPGSTWFEVIPLEANITLR
jgi:hypothetical protein